MLRIGETDYVIYDPTVKERYIAQFYYEKLYDKLSSDMMTRDQAEALLIERSIWSEEKNKKIEYLKDLIKKLREQLPLVQFQSNRRDDILRHIENSKKDLSELATIKNSLLVNTVEYQAMLARYKMFVFLLSRNISGDRVWDDWNIFEKNDDKLIHYLVNQCFLKEQIDDSKLRELARTEPWRSIWCLSNKTGELWSVPNVAITDLQKALSSWSMIYDMAYESMDTPTDDVINNDELFDNWLEQQAEKRKNERIKNSGNAGITNNQKIANSKEIGVIAETPEDAKKIFNLNDNSGKQLLANRFNVVEKKGVIDEGYMPDIQRQLNMAANNLAMKKRTL